MIRATPSWSVSGQGGTVKSGVPRRRRIGQGRKFVFGYLDDQRASAESKAPARIKEVRHPFLLSLERIEIIDGQLMIVTELADQSLKDRYESAGRRAHGHTP